MTNQPFTARNVAKYVAYGAVQHIAQTRVEQLMVDHTNFEEDDFVTRIGSNVIGWGVAAHFKPTTDRIVDSTANRVAAFREKRQAKKTAKKQDNE